MVAVLGKKTRLCRGSKGNTLRAQILTGSQIHGKVRSVAGAGTVREKMEYMND
jgi:hypothetical protein